MSAVRLLLLLLLHCIVSFRPIEALFSPKDHILINCGGNETVLSADGRTFLPDTLPDASSSFVLSPISHDVVRVGSSDVYGSARVFREAAEYRFRIRQRGRHFVRLHFYPIRSSLYAMKSAVFSVMANEYTLVRNFSYSKLDLGESFVLKEYIFRLERLSIKVTPSIGSIAFLNAIEIISLPDDLIPSVASTVPPGPAVEIPSRVGFETAFRINVGGPALDSSNDSLWRIWENDHPFLVISASVQNASTDPNLIRYRAEVPYYVAPNLVYATAHEMADASVNNQNFNISWVFLVESGFQYLVRFHFCDFITTTESLLFNVYINNQSALSPFDISNKVGLFNAYFVDFIADVQMNSDRILVQIGPPRVMMNFPANAFLNGLEIMKLSGLNNDFDVHIENASGVQVAKNQKNGTFVVAICSVGMLSLLVIAAILVLFFGYHRYKNKSDLAGFLSPIAPTTHLGNSDTKISTLSDASSGASPGIGQLLAFSEIREATKNFDESLVVGIGGFGKVYKGVFENGLIVAVKRGNPRSQQGLTEFRTEIEMLSKLQHRHLVSFIGYCHEANEMVLVYEFMGGGPLRKHLYGSDLPPLSWKQRLQICIGAAKGLHYLHTGASETIIHRDVKTTNILLDENLTAKVADFGLSKMGPTIDQTHVSTAVKGSFGYLDPEYFRRQQLTEKSDVYSFGVVLLEVLCARPAINPALPRDQVNLVEWVMNWQKQGQLEQIIDPYLAGTVSLYSLAKFGATAEKCLAEYSMDRPSMGDVLWNLEYALQLHETFSSVVGDGGSRNCMLDLPEWLSQVENIENELDMISVSSDVADVATSRVFSQLMNPKGR
ncbi:receptor-like protein kinase THESEUS 1 [Curcuma longa]|uniref:receptor-like protein kinase THESEUS 1 n=1 Tax=Curcuma longa TaxID=136217 RepID=UPI003D9F33CC